MSWLASLGAGAGGGGGGGGGEGGGWLPRFFTGKQEPKGKPRLSNKGGNALSIALGQNVFNLKNAATMKQVSREFSGITSSHYRGSYNDTGVVYRGRLSDWRQNFPNAVCLNVSYRQDLTDEDFRSLSRDARIGPPLQHLNIAGCTGITDKAFEYFTHMRVPAEGGAHVIGTLVSLDMTNCTQITDAAFVHLRGIKDLVMIACNQDEITDAAFQHLQGIEALEMVGCDQATITNAAIQQLQGITELSLHGCTQLSDGCLNGLGTLRVLDIGRCHLMTDASIAHLERLKRLEISECPLMTDAAVSTKRGLKWLCINACPQLTDAAFENLDGILELRMADCTGITAAALEHLHGIQILVLDGCNLEDENEEPIFQHIQGIKELSLEDCPFVSDHDLATLLGIRKLNIKGSSAVLSERTMEALSLTLKELVVEENDHPDTLRVAALYGVTPDNATVEKPAPEGSQRKSRKKKRKSKRRSNRR